MPKIETGPKIMMSKQTKKHEECQYFSDFLSKNLRYKNSKELWTINP